MKPGKLDLPTIWRGCVYPPVQVAWTDGQGNPIDVSGWHPRAYSRDFQFAVEVRDARHGITALSLPSTSDLKLGATNWDFIWNSKVTPFTMSQPFLKGSVEIKEPVTDPRTPVMGRTGGGSNYVKMFLRDVNPDIFISVLGRYHQTYAPPGETRVPIAPLARSQMAQMVANGQTKITFFVGFVHAYLDVPNPPDRVAMEYVDNIYLIPFNPVENNVEVRMTDQHQLNMVNFLNDIKDAGFTQVNIRFQVGGFANTRTWLAGSHSVWMQARYEHNRHFIMSVIDVVEANKGDLAVIYDLGLEHANKILLAQAIPPDENQELNDVHRMYCRFLWASYCSAHDPHRSTAFSIVGQFNPTYFPGKTPLGIVALLELFTTYQLPLPGYFGWDLYGRQQLDLDPNNTEIHDMLVDGFDYIKTNYHHGEETKPFIIQETFYNDGRTLLQIERALGERRDMNLQSIFQWPTIRGHRPVDVYTFPDGYPFDFTAYKTL